MRNRTVQKITKKLPTSGAEPTFSMRPYGTPIGVSSNNCYAYAVGHYSTRAGFKLQPGQLSNDNSDFELSSCKTIIARVKKDNPGSYVSGMSEQCKPGFTKVFIALDPDEDYHFYMQNMDVEYDCTTKPRCPTSAKVAEEFGVSLSAVKKTAPKMFYVTGAKVWSHKRGISGPPLLVDANDKLITNPEKANRDYGSLNYKKSCKTLCITRRTLPTTNNNGKKKL
jgi:hypothetical protein